MPPADDDARAFMLQAEDDPESQRRSISPVWHRRSGSYGGRAQSPFGDRPRNFQSQVLSNMDKLGRQTVRTWNHLTPLQRILAGIVGVVTMILGILFLIYHEKIFHAIVPYAAGWRDLPGGWLILWFLIIIVSFPPLFGYSLLLTITGFVYGFPRSWPIVASATVVGSTVAFIASRSLLKDMVERRIKSDPRFNALALTIKHDGLRLLIMIRLCPLPYSISNGGIATIPTVSPLSFAIATAAVTPKLLIHCFVGSQLARIAEEGGTMDGKTKAVSYLSILIGMVAGAATGWFMYRKFKTRAAELEAEEAARVTAENTAGIEREYADDPEALESARRLRAQQSDISLRVPNQGYRDVSPVGDDRGVGKGSEDAEEIGDVFDVGDGFGSEPGTPRT